MTPPKIKTWQASDANYATRMRDSFAQQTIMSLLGAEMGEVKPGFCEIRLPFRRDLCQQDGFFHAGVTATIADSAGGYAAFSLMPAESRVLTVEYKINLLAPADGDLLIARGEVVKPGRTLTITKVDVDIVKGTEHKPCAVLQQTLMCLKPEPE